MRLEDVLTGVQRSHVTACAFTKSPLLNHHHVAVVLSSKTGNVLASATNVATKAGSIHAEVGAIRQLHHRLKDKVLFAREVKRGAILLSFRINAKGQLMFAKPCANCVEAIQKSGLVKHVAWSNECGTLVCEKCM